MLTIILAESSLELIPIQIHNHPSVRSYSKKYKKNPSEILLDNSWHFAAMKGLENEIKRGRPDIVHLTLLSLCTTPAFYENKIKVFVHTLKDEVISLNNKTRLPKSYHRFQGLMEKLLVAKTIKSDEEILMEVKNSSLSELISEIQPTQIIGLTTKGQKISLENLFDKINDNSCVVIGGFQKSHFSDSVGSKIDQLVSIDSKSLDSHIVTARILYEYEKTIFK